MSRVPNEYSTDTEICPFIRYRRPVRHGVVAITECILLSDTRLMLSIENFGTCTIMADRLNSIVGATTVC